MRILPGCAIYVGFLGVAETAEYAMLAPMRRVCEVSDDCRDHRLCVFDADAQRVLVFWWLRRWRICPFQCGSTMLLRILMDADSGSGVFFCVLMVAEMADFAFSARVRSACWHSDGCGVAISARSRNSFCMLMVAAMLERALSAWFRKVCSQTRPRPRDV